MGNSLRVRVPPRAPIFLIEAMDEKIIVIEDETAIRRVVVLALKTAGYLNILEASTGDEGLALTLRERPNLVLLDLMLPGMDGLEVCRQIRANEATRETPVIMLTAKSEEHDVVRGLDVGANDYVTKPFSKEILLARIRAVLRRPDAERRKPIELEGLLIDGETHSASLKGAPLELTLSEYRILELLVRNKNRVFARSHIIDRISDGQKIVTDRTVDVQMVNLRRKLGSWASHIKTVRGVGYRVS